MKGNHDSSAPFPDTVIDLHRQTHEFGGFVFGGLNGAWKYKPRGHFLYEQWEAEAFCAELPPVDIFISHNSPAGIHDRQDDVHYGFSGLNKYIVRAQPPLLVHGHQHVNQESFK